MNLSLAVNHALGGESPRGYHVFNLLVHSLNALLLFALARRTLAAGAPAALLPAWFLAALWALHPLQTESVTCVVQRTETLGAFWYLLTLLAFASGRRRLAVGACLLGMATKETMVTAPLVVLLYDRTFLAGSFRTAWRARARTHLALAATWLLLVWLVLGAGGARGTAGGFGAAMSSWHYLLQQTRAVLLYLKLALWPHPLVVDYGTAAPASLAEVPGPALAVVALLAATIWALVRRPRAGFLGAWFFVILAPSSSFVPLPAQTIAEHRVYLPLAALVAGGVALAFRVAPRLAPLVLAGLLAAAAGRTAQRNEVFRSELALWADTVAHRPDNPRALTNLGSALLEADRRDEALAAFRRAAVLQPNSPAIHANLCLVLTLLGQPAEAQAEGEAAVELAPDDLNAWINLTQACALANDPAATRRHLARVQALSLADPQLYFLAGHLARRSEDYAAALALYRRAVALDAGFAAARNNVANLLLIAGRFDEAIREYETILRAQPDDPRVRENLARARELRAGRGEN